MTFTLYCNCFRQLIPYVVQKNQKNLMLGSSEYPKELRDALSSSGYILDDIGDNISKLNRWFGQICGLYWVFKNSNEDFVGMNTYRIFWDDYHLSNINLDDNKIYVPCKLDITTDICDYKNLKNQFIVSHRRENFDLLMSCVSSNRILLEDIESWDTQQKLYPFSMFISNKKIFDKVCTILFDLAFDFFDVNRYTIYNYSDHYGRIRQMDFICERILHLIINNLSYYIPNVEVIEIPIYQYAHL